ncbi:hypothetical protein B2J93_2901 [Marssonina coronariae]|uniref:Uncharacterized protein n=1 Tax=Diplocarpon coronariae TaxID=2795749 RepID=A0A218YVF7_9HELO|nr:hypothetical protein B2J93_2901 [Marssonina coronariae]
MGSSTSTPKHLQRSSKTKSVIFTFEDYRDGAPDDERISQEVGALQLAVTDHCRGYYHDRQTLQAPQEIETILLRDKDKYPNLTITEISHLLCDIRTRQSALSCFVSHMVIKNIGFFSRKSTTLLSPGAISCIQEFGFGDPEVKLTLEEEVSFAQWRAVTAHLLPHIEKRPTRYQNTRIDRLLKAMNDILLNFHDPVKKDTERLTSLRSIIEKTAIVGEMILASASRWKFDWHASRCDLKAQDKRSKNWKQQHSNQAFEKEGKAVVIVRFPALIQINAQDLVNKRRQQEFGVVITIELRRSQISLKKSDNYHSLQRLRITRLL